mmetsp:Transcript_21569/g.50763  ORF Transcript_21569/g.50763 Transcript_21569/m.50763 type:complete len:529 (+) Transcript_21569:1-1587(+)
MQAALFIGMLSAARRVPRRLPVPVRSFYNVKEVNVPNWLNGKPVQSKSTEWVEHCNPATLELISRVPNSTPEEMQAAVDSAKKAFESWRRVPFSSRVRIMMRFMELIRDNQAELIHDITTEHGKTIADATGEIVRGMEVVEHACSLSARAPGGMVSGLATEVDTYSWREPLGVTATIMPFNFPFMCPLWSVPIALVTGNTVVMKPSEKVPHGGMNIAKMFTEAGLPDGCLNVIHGQARTVNFICDDPDIRTISFVGSNRAGEHIYARASPSGKRVQCNMGAKNHIVIMPDADKETALNGIMGSAFGAAGQRCMANSVGVFVGEAKNWIPDLVERASKLRVGEGHAKESDFGPLISPEAKTRAVEITKKSVGEGAKLLLDGLNPTVPAPHDKGNFLGATILGDVKADMECYKEEIFAPVFSTLAVDTLDDAIAFVNASPYGNGTSIVTNSGAAARKYQYEVQCGQVGINVPIPVGLYFFGFTGWKASFRGSNHFYGQDGINFFTESKTVIAHWKYEGSAEMQMAFPQHK